MKINWKSNSSEKNGSFEIDLVGEGIVWSCNDERYRGPDFTFKVKGALHAEKSHVKTLAPVDVEKLHSVKEFVDEYVVENRLQKGLDFLRENNLTIDNSNIGHFLKWIANDIFKECLDEMAASNLNNKDVGKQISNKARNWFLTYTSNNF